METQVPYGRMPSEPGQVVGTNQAMVPQQAIIVTAPPQRITKDYSTKANIVLGIIQTVCGVALIGLGITLLIVGSRLAPVSSGIWCGVIIVLSGVFQIVAGKTRSRCWIVTSLVFSILAAVFVVPVLVVSGLDIARTDWIKYRWEVNTGPDGGHYLDLEDWDSYYIPNWVQICFAVVEGVIAIVSCVLACRPLCCSSYEYTAVTQQIQYVTTNQAGQLVMVTPVQMNMAPNQQVMAVPVAAQPGAPPMYHTVMSAPMGAPQVLSSPTQPIPHPDKEEKVTIP